MNKICTLMRGMIAIVVLMLMLNAWAVTDDMYHVVIPVTDKSANQTTLLRMAFEQVLIKVAGNRAIINDPTVQKQLNNAQRVVLDYTYLEKSGVDGKRRLQVRFDPALIQEVLLGAEQEIWGGQRPVTVVWLVNDDGKKKHIVATDTDEQLSKIVAQVSEQRGLPMTLPLMDLEDLAKINPDEIWQLDIAAISSASIRYASPVQIIAKVNHQQAGNKLTVDWYILHDYSRKHYSNTAESLTAALEAGLQEGIDFIARRYAHNNSQQGHSAKVVLTVYNVNGIDHYATLIAYLKQLQIIDRFEIQRIGGEDVTLELSVLGGRQAIVKSFSEDKKLEPMKKGGALDANNLRYQMSA